MLQYWEPYFRKRCGKHWPDDYLAFDLETTGFADLDLITEIGHCMVRDREPANRLSVLLDWTRHKSVDQKWLRERLIKLAGRMAESGKPMQITYERLHDEGRRPEEVFAFYHELLGTVRETMGFFVGTNVYSFDARVFHNAVLEFTGLDWTFGDDEVFDVGAMEKAVQLSLRPFHDETLRKYFGRVQAYTAKGVRWNVEHCMQKYALCERYNLNADDCHGAKFDSYVSHLMFEEFRTAVHANKE